MSFDPSKPVQTKTGHKVRILRSDQPGPYPILAVIDDGTRNSYRLYTEGGRFVTSFTHEEDLVNLVDSDDAHV